MDLFNIDRIKNTEVETVLNLVKSCEPLDLHTPYTYWVLCHYFGDYSFIIRDETDIPVGLITSLLINNEIIFIWQIGIIKEYRRKGIGKKLIRKVINKAKENEIKKIQFTIDFSNNASLSTFRSIAKEQKAEMKKIGESNIELNKKVSNEDIYEIKLPLTID